MAEEKEEETSNDTPYVAASVKAREWGLSARRVQLDFTMVIYFTLIVALKYWENIS